MGVMQWGWGAYVHHVMCQFKEMAMSPVTIYAYTHARTHACSFLQNGGIGAGEGCKMFYPVLRGVCKSFGPTIFPLCSLPP